MIRVPSRHLLITLVLLAGAWLAGSPLHAQQSRFNEREVKAVFLFNFAQFVDWPPEAFPDSASPFVIGVLGQDTLGMALDDAVKGETIGERRLVVMRFRRVEDVKNCQVLFISPSEAGRYRSTFVALQKMPVLTVGDTEGFATEGGMIRFVTERNRIRLRVNVTAAKAAGLTISSRLLRAAEVVATEQAP